MVSPYPVRWYNRDGEPIGYVTGTRAFAGLALTTQVPPSVRAQMGAILECLGYFATTLMDSLNPLTCYKIGITPSALPTAKTWNIV